MTARILVASALLALAACGSPRPTGPAELKMDGSDYRVTGPYVHENLAVYLIHAKDADPRDFATLDEALEKGWVKVSEKEQEQVSQLLLENLGERPVFIQEGDRVIGGKQDRIIGSSFVVPPHSGPQPIPSFCVEQSRWSEGRTGKGFYAGANSTLATKEIREAAKMSKDQGQVWDKVAQTKRAAAQQFSTGNENSSLNETLEDPKIKELCEAYAKALASIAEKHPDAVGIAIAMNGKVEEVNLYPAPSLLRRMAPRLVQSYALPAAADRKDAPVLTSDDVVRFMKETDGREAKAEEINAKNRVLLVASEQQYRCVTEYEGKTVHGQWMRRSEDAGEPRSNDRNLQNRQQFERNNIEPQQREEPQNPRQW